MSILPFIEELTEARMFYGVKDITGMSVSEIAEIVFLMFMMIEVIRQYNPNWSANYAADTMKYNTYENLNYAGSDLGNLLAVLNNQDTFKAYIKSESGVAIPLYQINRYLRDLISKSKSSHSDDITFFWRLEDYLKLYSNSLLRQLRRDVGNWKDLTKANKEQIYLILRREFDKRCSSTDMYLWYKSSFKITEDITESEINIPAYMNPLPPQGKILASYTDEDGYTISIRGGVPKEKEMALGQRRYGQYILTSPEGKSVIGGYWMAWPEEEWDIWPTKWDIMSWEQRAAMEAKHQATAYRPLKDQFENRLTGGEFNDRLGQPAEPTPNNLSKSEESATLIDNEPIIGEDEETERLDIKEDGDWEQRVFFTAYLTKKHRNWIHDVEFDRKGHVNRGEAILDLNKKDQSAYISRMDVTPTGKGFGSELLKYIIGQCKKHGYNLIRAYTEWENINSKDMLRKAGFKEIRTQAGDSHWELALS